MAENHRVRYERLQQVFGKAMSQTLMKLQSWEKLSSCFVEYGRTEEGARNLAHCQQQVAQFWLELCKREFEEIMTERDVEKKLNELDDLIAQAKLQMVNKKRPKNGLVNVLSDKNLVLADMDSEAIVECKLHGQRIKAIEEFDERLNIINDLNRGLEKRLETLESKLANQKLEVTEIYDKALGSSINKPADDVLVQGLKDMLLELNESG